MYVMLVAHDQSQIIGSVLNSVFIVSGFEIPPNLTWICKSGLASEVSATEENGQLLCPIPITAAPASHVRTFVSSLQQLFVGKLNARRSSQI